MGLGSRLIDSQRQSKAFCPIRTRRTDESYFTYRYPHSIIPSATFVDQNRFEADLNPDALEDSSKYYTILSNPQRRIGLKSLLSYFEDIFSQKIKTSACK